MKKALGIITLIITICLIFVLMIWQWDKIKSIENNVNKRIENIENKDENVRNKINKFAESVKFSDCNNQSYDHSKYWTAFIYNLNSKKVLMTVWHNIVENPSTFFWWCWVNLVWDYNEFSLINTKKNSDSAMYRYTWKVNAIDIPLCDKIEKKSQKVWVIWYPAYTHITDKEKDSTLTITEWIISWYTTMANWLTQEHLNYFVTNNLDIWNSWWPAILETKNWFCLLWIMTWAQTWKYISQWIVQNIHNVIEK
jgi:hypothetical protein